MIQALGRKSLPGKNAPAYKFVKYGQKSLKHWPQFATHLARNLRPLLENLHFTRCQCYKPFFGIISATIGISPYNFDWGYEDSGIIYVEKSFKTLANGANVIKLFFEIISTTIAISPYDFD